VQQLPKGATRLQVKGLAPGKHRFFLTSQREIFSPDLGELICPPTRGCTWSRSPSGSTRVLYGKPDPLPAAEGLPGVTATLLK